MLRLLSHSLSKRFILKNQPHSEFHKTTINCSSSWGRIRSRWGEYLVDQDEENERQKFDEEILGRGIETRNRSFEGSYVIPYNRSRRILEEKISELEGAESTIATTSGLCAKVLLLRALVPAGGHLITTTDCYITRRMFMETVLPNMEITTSVVDPADIGALQSALEQNNASLFFTESPTDRFLRCVDIKLVSELCHKNGALLCIDGTFATPFNQKALALGADLVMHSFTKYFGVHRDVHGGCVSGSTKLISEIQNLQHILGGDLYSSDADRFIRGMKTLHLRVQQQNSTGMRMAELLEAHPKVKRVYYPGLPSHPEHKLAMRQMTGFGGFVSFEIDGDPLHTTKIFADSLKIPFIDARFVRGSNLNQPAILSYWDIDIDDNLATFSFGVEDFEDLKADVLQALEAI